MQTDSFSTELNQPVAVVGIGCRFPGGANDPRQFWDLLINGRDAITEIPKTRWNAAKFYDPDGAIAGRTQARYGGFVENVELFDPQFFGISPREAIYLDPQQRLLLETAWEALEDGGMPLDPKAGAKGGVFVGISTQDYCSAQSGWNDGMDIDMYTPTGGAMSIAANRVSFCLNLQGPSMAVDTACSSSLVAVHLAVQSLLNGDCEFALAGGVNLILNPNTYIGFSRMSMLACDGRCKPFDARANGFARAEGGGMLLLKPLSVALASNDRIYALIRGTAVNQDGSESPGMTMPAQSSQETVIRAACARAGILPGEISLVEAHGTGTPVGDPIEARAIGSVIGKNRKPGDRLLLGSVKSNIGHLESGAGIAGITKAILSLYHRTVPPSLNFESPNPGIDFNDLNLAVPVSPVSLPGKESAVFAGVNSFGFGGTNAHVVLETPPPRLTAKALPTGTCLLPLSAKGETALINRAASIGDAIRVGGSVNGSSWEDICYTLASRRFHHLDHRGALVAENREEAVRCLKSIAKGEPHTGWIGEDQVVKTADRRIVFVFCGQGPQWFAMGRQLIAEDAVFREKMEACDRLIRQLGNWSLLEELSRSEEDSRIQDTAISQPAIFAIQVALAARWKAWGIEPSAVVGHSVGEVAASHLAGVYSLEDAVRVIFHRGRTMSRAGKGAMLAAGLGSEDAEALLLPFGKGVCLAASNGPASVTLSGDPDKLREIAEELDRRGIFQKALRVEYAFHSEQMDPVREELLASLEGLKPSPAGLPLYSTVSGRSSDGAEYEADYWWRNVRQPVRFCEAIQELIGEGYQTFLELGPHPALTAPLQETLRHAGQKGNVFASLRRQEEERSTLLKSLGSLYVAGHQPDWNSVCPGSLVSLPAYPWERDPYWAESERFRNYRLGERHHPLLGDHYQGAEPSWVSRLGDRTRDLIDDHRVQDRALFPAAGYLEMALEAARQTIGDEPCDLEGVEFLKAFFLPSKEERCRMRLVHDPETHAFRIYGEMPGQTGWARHCTGEIRQVPESRQATDPTARPQLLGGEEVDIADCYELFRSRGLHYGPKFQGLQKLFRKDGEALGLVKIPDDAKLSQDRFRFHPSLLDGCFQVLIAAVPQDDENGPAKVFLPTRIERFRFYRDAGEEIWSHVSLHVIGSDVIVGSIRLFDNSGEVVAELEGFTCRAAGTIGGDSTRDWLYGFELEPCPLPGTEFVASPQDYLPPMETIAAAMTEQIARDAAMEPWGAIYQEKKSGIDHLCRVYIRRALRDLGWQPAIGQAFLPCDLAQQLGVAERHYQVLERYLGLLAEDGTLYQDGTQWLVEKWDQDEDPNRLWREGVENFPAHHVEYGFIRRFGDHLAEVLKGDRDSVQMLFDHDGRPAEDLYARSWSMRRCNTMVCAALESALAQVPKGRRVRILEIGAGTGGMTEWVLRSLPADKVSYVFTDVTAHFLGRAEERFGEFSFVEFDVLNIEKSPLEQGFDAHSFDIILASNVIHATQNLDTTLRHVRQLMAPGGMVALLELVNQPLWIDLVFGLMEGWWAMTDDRSGTFCPLIEAKKWKEVFARAGFETPCAVESDDGCQAVVLAREPQNRQPKSILPLFPEKTEGAWLFFADQSGIAAKAADSLREEGHQVILFSQSDEDFDDANEIAVSSQNLVESLQNLPPLGGIVHFWSLDLKEPEGNDFEALDAIEQNISSVIEIIKNATGGKGSAPLWLITRGAQPENAASDMSLAQAPLIGIARTIVNEHPGLRCRSVDLESKGILSPAEEARRIVAELSVDDKEEEILYRGEGRFGTRLIRTTAPIAPTKRVDAADHAYGLEILQPGVLDTMVFQPRPRIEPGPGEVEIQVACGALNFRDVMKALGIYPTEGDEPLLLGDECAGTVVRVGEGVTSLKPGDRVAAIAQGCFGSHAILPAELVLRFPDRLQFDEAVTLPIAYLTAAYALEHLAGIRQGEKVLIHAATGGVGLAAIQIAREIGATIFATAGSPEKRAFLRGIGVEHVMDSRNLSFYDEIREITGGTGVDIVLNSLAGEAIDRSLNLLGDYGRFLEIGKRDIYQNTRIGLRAFRKNVSYHAIDLSRTLRDRIPLVRSLLNDLERRFEKGSLRPLPQLVFSSSQVVAAFRTMREARHIGKLIISFADEKVTLSLPSKAKPLLREEGTCLVSGGLGGFGLESARWLADGGAKDLILISRSGPVSDEAKAAVIELERQGIRVLARAADVCSFAQVSAVLKEAEEAGFPPLRGILHAAMVLDDAGLVDQHPERMHRAFAPKARGAWVLHQLAPHGALDFFVMYSSFTSIVGSPGQANYSAGNIFMEALAHHRRSQGQNAFAVNWGHIGQTGFVSRNDEVGQRLNRGGFHEMAPRQALKLEGDLIRHGHTQVGVADIDWRKLESLFIGTGSSPRFKKLVAETASAEAEQDASRIRDRIQVASPEEQGPILRDYLLHLVARVLRTAASKLDTNRPLTELGLDSLMAVELINRMESDLGVGVPTGQLASRSIDELKVMLLPLVTGSSRSADSGKTGKAPTETPPEDDITVTIGGYQEIEPARFLAALRHRYEKYSGKNLIGPNQREVPTPDFLKQAFEAEGVTVPERMNPSAFGIDFDHFDFLPSCCHFIISSGDGIQAYLRLIEENAGEPIPARKIYEEEIENLTGTGQSAEISRLIYPGGNGSGSGLVLEKQQRLGDRMFEIIDQYAQREGIGHLFAQVHPIHGTVYEQLGIFTRHGEEKPCPGVNNAPAVLMHRQVKESA